MDRVEHYRELVKGIIRENAQLKPSYGDIEIETVMDDVLGHYELIYTGWDRQRRVLSSVIHIDIRDGKIWIQHDGTSGGIALELVAAGVPQKHIVLAFHHPDKRKYTPYAVS